MPPWTCCRPSNTRPAPRPAGASSGCTAFAPIVPELVRPGWPALRCVFPHAPVRPVTINNGMRMRAWYDIRNFSADELGGGDRADIAGVLESVAQVEALVAREGERGIPPS